MRRRELTILTERTGEKLLDRPFAAGLKRPCAGSGEMLMLDDRRVRLIVDLPPVVAVPPEPAVLVLIEDVERLVAQFGELGAPAGSAAHGAIVEDRSDHVDFLAAVDLVPERLQNLPKRRAVGIGPVHQSPDIRQADVTGLQLLVIQDAHAAMAGDFVPLEGEVDLVDAAALGESAELGLGAGRAAAEQDAVGWR